MALGPPILADWRDAAGYASLRDAGPGGFAWEWLRRDSAYRDVAHATDRAIGRCSGGAAITVLRADPDAARWGLHAFEDPALPAAVARPVWLRAHCPRTLVAAAEPDGAAEDRFDLSRFASLTTLVRKDSGTEHLLLSDGLASVRLDIAAGSLLAGPVRLTYRLAGFAEITGPLTTLHALARLNRSGRLPGSPARSRNRRLVVLLRALDALQAGADQREIAEVLLSAEAAGPRWRTEAPSLRLQAQRLAGGARAMARGGYFSLLRA